MKGEAQVKIAAEGTDEMSRSEKVEGRMGEPNKP